MSRLYFRPGAVVGHVLVLAAVLTCLRLGWWQWDVAHAARGTVQNLGYALLWPVFAGAFIYMWLRFLHLEAEHSDAGADEPAALPTGAGSALDTGVPADGTPSPAEVVGEHRAGQRRAERHRAERHRDEQHRELRHTGSRPLPHARRRRGETYVTGVGMIDASEEDDSELAAYNRALARLAERDDDSVR